MKELKEWLVKEARVHENVQRESGDAHPHPSRVTSPEQIHEVIGEPSRWLGG